MRTGRSKKPLVLTNEEREKLEQWARRPKTAQRLALRSRVVLGCAGGLSNQAVARQCGVSAHSVGKWRERFRSDRLVGCKIEGGQRAKTEILVYTSKMARSFHTRFGLLMLCVAAQLVSAAPASTSQPRARAARSVAKGGDWAPPVVRLPSGLIADAGDGKAYLEWNPNLEENLAGYLVYRQDGGAGAYKRISSKIITAPEFVDRGLKNGQVARYRVTAISRTGVESGRSRTYLSNVTAGDLSFRAIH